MELPQRKETVETRWFFGSPPFALELLFRADQGSEPREDWYAMPCDAGTGTKWREGRLETKLRVASYAPQRMGAVEGIVEHWIKWSVALDAGVLPPDSDLLQATGWCRVVKERYLRSFEVHDGRVVEVADRPQVGCDLEWTNLNVHGRSYWTVGLEAVGPRTTAQESIERVLRHVVAEVVPHNVLRQQFTSARACGYPQWLQDAACRDAPS